MSEAIVIGPGEGQTVSARGSTMSFKAVASDTGGAFSFMERDLPAGGTPPPPHTHEGHEAFYVTGGCIEFQLGDRTVEGSPGTFVYVPPNVSHTFANRLEAPARLLILHAPAMDAYFRELEELWSGVEPPDRDAVTALMHRHGMEHA